MNPVCLQLSISKVETSQPVLGVVWKTVDVSRFKFVKIQNVNYVQVTWKKTFHCFMMTQVVHICYVRNAKFDESFSGNYVSMLNLKIKNKTFLYVCEIW